MKLKHKDLEIWRIAIQEKLGLVRV